VTPVFFSSDYVFKGDTGGYADDAPTEPTTEYGRQKVEVEQRLRELGPERSLIVRLSKVYGIERGDGTLFDSMAATLVQRGTVRAAEDQRFCPTFVVDVLENVRRFLRLRVRGTVNLCADEPCSRFELASMLHLALGGSGRVERTTMVALGLHGRPRDTTMRCTHPAIDGLSYPLTMAIGAVAKTWLAT
jgi:dTDP-4-dehydrorhamnose reductase